MKQVENEKEIGAAGSSWRWGPETPDQAVLERVRAGETAAYEVLVRRYDPPLRRVVGRVLPNEADVEEVIQEAHFNALRFIRQFSGQSSFATWLARIAIHAALGRRRSPAYSRELSPICFDGKTTLETVASAQLDPEQQLQDKEARDALEAAVATLPESYRAVFALRMVEELSTTEAAMLLEISEACAKTRLRRARALLRNRFQFAPAFGGASAIREVLAGRNGNGGKRGSFAGASTSPPKVSVTGLLDG